MSRSAPAQKPGWLNSPEPRRSMPPPAPPRPDGPPPRMPSRSLRSPPMPPPPRSPRMSPRKSPLRPRSSRRPQSTSRLPTRFSIPTTPPRVLSWGLSKPMHCWWYESNGTDSGMIICLPMDIR
ncbi:hypothetical protein Vafri_22061 [Volvox africanus]|uniref:Uncharacterized protein n=1 Tax=Volvox africanus TaxID=51714 RepID=A0A8J4FBZ3_9CHLO|nr:hypothetical protein Vafri_22061 [Volvox africanus]